MTAKKNKINFGYIQETCYIFHTSAGNEVHLWKIRLSKR